MKTTRFANPVRWLLGVLALLLMLLQIQGCAAAGQSRIVAPKDFAQTEIVTMSIASEVLAQADILLAGGVIKPADARSLVRQTDEVKSDVELARSLVVGDPQTAQGRIDLALKTIQGVRDYLLKRGAAFSPTVVGS